MPVPPPTPRVVLEYLRVLAWAWLAGWLFPSGFPPGLGAAGTPQVTCRDLWHFSKRAGCLRPKVSFSERLERSRSWRPSGTGTVIPDGAVELPVMRAAMSLPPVIGCPTACSAPSA